MASGVPEGRSSETARNMQALATERKATMTRLHVLDDGLGATGSHQSELVRPHLCKWTGALWAWSIALFLRKGTESQAWDIKV